MDSCNNQFGTTANMKLMDIDTNPNEFGKITLSTKNPSDELVDAFMEVKTKIKGGDIHRPDMPSHFYNDGLIADQWYDGNEQADEGKLQFDVIMDNFGGSSCGDKFSDVYPVIYEDLRRAKRGYSSGQLCSRSRVIQFLLDNFVVLAWREIAVMSVFTWILSILVLEGRIPAILFSSDRLVYVIISMFFFIYSGILHSAALTRFVDLERQIVIGMGGTIVDLSIHLQTSIKEGKLLDMISIPTKVCIRENGEYPVVRFSDNCITALKGYATVAFLVGAFPTAFRQVMKFEKFDADKLPLPRELREVLKDRVSSGIHEIPGADPLEVLRSYWAELYGSLIRGGIVPNQLLGVFAKQLDAVGTIMGTVGHAKEWGLIPYPQKSILFITAFILCLFTPFAASPILATFTSGAVFWYLLSVQVVVVFIVGSLVANFATSTYVSKDASYTTDTSDINFTNIADGINRNAVRILHDALCSYVVEELKVVYLRKLQEGDNDDMDSE